MLKRVHHHVSITKIDQNLFASNAPKGNTRDIITRMYLLFIFKSISIWYTTVNRCTSRVLRHARMLCMARACCMREHKANQFEIHRRRRRRQRSGSGALHRTVHRSGVCVCVACVLGENPRIKCYVHIHTHEQHTKTVAAAAKAKRCLCLHLYTFYTHACAHPWWLLWLAAVIWMGTETSNAHIQETTPTCRARLFGFGVRNNTQRAAWVPGDNGVET